MFGFRIGFGIGGEAGDGTDGGLDAAEERGDEDPVDRESGVGSERPTSADCPGHARLVQRWVPGPRGLAQPFVIHVVEAVAVP